MNRKHLVLMSRFRVGFRGDEAAVSIGKRGKERKGKERNFT